MRRALASMLLLVAFLLSFAGSASAYVDYSSKNRVGSFGDPFAPQVGFADPFALEPYQENTIAVYDPATGVLFYVRQNPWTYFDPLGLRAETENETAELEKLDNEAADYRRREKVHRDAAGLDANKDQKDELLEKANGFKKEAEKIANSARNIRDMVDRMTDDSPDISKVISGEVAPWVRDAMGEIGVEEWKNGWNPNIREYQNSSEKPKFFTDDGTGRNAWCACFVNWALERNGVPGATGGYSSIRAWSPGSKTGEGFGVYGTAENVKNPRLGSLGITGKGGYNHVGFIMGTQQGRFVMLGGNQDDRVSVATKFYGSDRRARVPVGGNVGPRGIKFKAGSYTDPKSTR